MLVGGPFIGFVNSDSTQADKVTVKNVVQEKSTRDDVFGNGEAIVNSYTFNHVTYSLTKSGIFKAVKSTDLSDVYTTQLTRDIPIVQGATNAILTFSPFQPVLDSDGNLSQVVLIAEY